RPSARNKPCLTPENPDVMLGRAPGAVQADSCWCWGARGQFKTEGLRRGGTRYGQAPLVRGGCEMQAMHGYAISFRSRGRLIGCCLVLALVLAAAMSIPSMASAQATEKYLALGDSLAFGFSSQQYHIGEEKGFESPELF